MTDATPPDPNPPPILPPIPAPTPPAPPGPAIPFLHALLTGPGGKVLRAALVFYGLVAVFALGYAIFSREAGRLFGETYPSGGGFLIGLFLGLGIAGACQVTSRTLPAVGAAADAIGQMIGPLSYGAVAALALASGIAEELLFRGALWPHLHLLGTTFLFGLVHVMWQRPLRGYPVFALVVGLLFGLLRQGTENVIPCMVAHATLNGLNLGTIEWRRRKGAASAPKA